MDWIRTSHETHPWFKKQDPNDLISHSKCCRVYTPNGKDWPIFSMALYELSMYGEGIKVSASKKEAAGDWFNEACVPVELIPELIEMLNEFASEG